MVLATHPEQARAMYGFLKEFIQEKGYEPIFQFPDQRSLGDSVYIFGHSNGTNTVLEEYSPDKYPAVQGIMLFDPSEQYRRAWNALEVQRWALISKTVGNRPWATGFDHSTYVNDGHFFTKSFDIIHKKLDEIVE
ncbi:MAG: hypothetical protein KKG59_07085 [Nanoarchaeota archaeon]|nr:hypothetical protein [Nanoarchaeota archaeon]